MWVFSKFSLRKPAILKNWQHIILQGQTLKSNLLEKLGRKTRTWTEQMTTRSTSSFEKVNTIINQVTGYAECEQLRSAVKDADRRFQGLKETLRHSRAAFDHAIQHRSQCQKELNALLQRKQSWLDEDLLRFTELYRKEMRLEQVEIEAKMTNEKLENDVDTAHQALMDALRERYQEEQLWSDKIRRLSTYGTFSLMSLNVILFLIIQIIIEPSKREKFTLKFEQAIADHVGRLQADLDDKIGQVISFGAKQSVLAQDPGDMPIRESQQDILKGAAGATLLLSFLYLINRLFIPL